MPSCAQATEGLLVASQSDEWQAGFDMRKGMCRLTITPRPMCVCVGGTEDSYEEPSRVIKEEPMWIDTCTV